jgi:TolA-binding protein
MKCGLFKFTLLLSLGFFLVQGCTSKIPTDKELLKSGTLHHSSDEYDEAISDFQLLVEKYPMSDRAPEALYAVGVIYQNKKKEYAKAESVYTKLVMNYPNDPTAQGAAYQRARLFVEHLNKPDSAIAAYELFLQRYPDAVSAASARSELSEVKKTQHAVK